MHHAGADAGPHRGEDHTLIARLDVADQLVQKRALADAGRPGDDHERAGLARVDGGAELREFPSRSTSMVPGYWLAARAADP